MKSFLFTCCFAFFALTGSAQFNLQQFNKERVQITKNGMLALGGWSAANIITGAIGLSNSHGESEYFHRMNLIWGSVNLVIAGASYISLSRKSSDISVSDSRKAQSAIEKTFLINGGLDLVYITAGMYLLEKGKNDSNPDKYRGFGKSVIMQGGALLIFDAVMYTVHMRHGKKFWKYLDGLQFAPGAVGIRVGI